MELVNGKQKQLTPVEVIGGALVNNNLGTSKSFVEVGTHLSNPTTTSVQINNTVFLYTYANKGKTKKPCVLYIIWMKKNKFQQTYIDFYVKHR